MCPTSDLLSKGTAVSTIRVLLIAALLLPVLIHCLAPEPQAQPRHPLTNEDVDQWMEELSNWGRWGQDNQLGALSLITPERHLHARRPVRHTETEGSALPGTGDSHLSGRPGGLGEEDGILKRHRCP